MKDAFLQGPDIAYRSNDFDPNRKTLVFIHGLSGTSSAWEWYEKALESDYNVVTYDLRGHGLSKKYAHYGDYKLKSFAADLHALLDHLQIEKCTLVSHSMGTLVALYFLHMFKNEAEAVLFLSPNYKQRTRVGTLLALPFLALFTNMYGLLPFHLKQGHRIDYAAFGYSPDISLKRIVPEIKDMSLRLYLYCLRQLYAFDQDKWWSQIKVPVTIVHGTKDSFVPYTFGVKLSKTVPNAKLIPLKGANHMLVLNNKAEILAAIKSL